MKMTFNLICIFLIIGLAACNGNVNKDKISENEQQEIGSSEVEGASEIPASGSDSGYSNARFKEVTVVKVGENTYTIQGKGQLYEATLNWVVEDGHHELKNGFATADKGGPDWGEFSFTVEVQKQRPQSTLTLVLYESSAKDGSRQHELPIVLEQ